MSLIMSLLAHKKPHERSPLKATGLHTYVKHVILASGVGIDGAAGDKMVKQFVTVVSIFQFLKSITLEFGVASY
jgi:hypothetical protein